jgi:O-antigen/teichoic acid export membrane protein
MTIKFKSNLIQSVFAFSVKLAAGISSYLIFVLLARIMGVDEFGLFSFCFSIIMIIGFSGNYGQQVFLVKQIPKERSHNNKGRELGAYYFSSFITLIAAIIGFLTFLTLVYLDFIPLSFTEALIAGVLCFLFSVSQTTIGVLRVQDKTLFGIFTRDLMWRLLSIILVFIFMWMNMSVNTYSALLIFTLSLLPIVILHLKVIFDNFDFKGVIRSVQFREWFNVSSGLALIAVISSVDLYLYTIVLGNLLSKVDVGAFFVSLKTVELMNLFLMAVTLIVAPQISSLISSNKLHLLQKKCNEAILLQGVPALISGIFVLVFAEYFLGFFNEKYIEYVDLLRFLVVGVLVNALTGATGLMMQLGGMHWRQVVYQGGSLIVSLMLLPYLVTYFGIIGAGISFIISKVLWNFLAIVAIRKKLGVDPSLLGFFTRNPDGLIGTFKTLVTQYK